MKELIAGFILLTRFLNGLSQPKSKRQRQTMRDNILCRKEDISYGKLYQDLIIRLEKEAYTLKEFDVTKDVAHTLELLSKLKQVEFSEFHDKEFADWKRVRMAIEHENMLKNHRITWLFSSQAFLIGSYTLAFIQWGKKENSEIAMLVYPFLLTVIAFFGAALSVYIWAGLKNAALSLRRLDRWWYNPKLREDAEKFFGEKLTARQIAEERKNADKNLLVNHPPLQGRLGSWYGLFNEEWIPLLFLLVWVIILVFSIILAQWQLQNSRMIL